ncbi:hypothetical protein PPYR_06092 [Photinus pyralis]|uniref:Uncharacterized protein n=1 Tax=Photinus pyralis TaxID=7054 RepID=A0A5N4ASK7_PHOPY|nr:hypothetical protein PPYR_06092 [Photinus pyralis]
MCLRLGVPVCVSHPCSCGEPTNILGYHGISCRISGGQKSRHNSINDIIKRALNSAEIPARCEANGCFRKDDKRPDGIILIPWKLGRPLVCADTLEITLVLLHDRLEKQLEFEKMINVESTIPDTNFHFVPLSSF